MALREEKTEARPVEATAVAVRVVATAAGEMEGETEVVAMAAAMAEAARAVAETAAAEKAAATAGEAMAGERAGTCIELPSAAPQDRQRCCHRVHVRSGRLRQLQARRHQASARATSHQTAILRT